MQLYSTARDAYSRLCDRLGVIDEDEDVEIIFNSFSQISKILSLQMFYYGSTLPTPIPKREMTIELSEVE